MSVDFDGRRDAMQQQQLEAARRRYEAEDQARLHAVIERGRRFRANQAAFHALCDEVIRPSMTELGKQLSAAAGHGYRIELDLSRPQITFYVLLRGVPFGNASAPSIGAFLTLSGGVGWVRTAAMSDGIATTKPSSSLPIVRTTRVTVRERVGALVREVLALADTDNTDCGFSG